MRLSSLMLVLVTASSPALAAVEWSGPGWYVVENNEDADTSKLFSGPFADQDACKAQLPDQSDDDYVLTGISYYCNRFPTQWPS